MDRDDRPRARRDRALDAFRVKIVRVGLDVGKYGGGANLRDGFRRGKKRVRGGDDFVTRSDATGKQRQLQGRAARGHSNCLADAQITRKGRLEALYLRPHDEAGTVDYPLDGSVDLGRAGRRTGPAGRRAGYDGWLPKTFLRPPVLDVATHVTTSSSNWRKWLIWFCRSSISARTLGETSSRSRARMASSSTRRARRAFSCTRKDPASWACRFDEGNLQGGIRHCGRCFISAGRFLFEPVSKKLVADGIAPVARASESPGVPGYGSGGAPQRDRIRWPA